MPGTVTCFRYQGNEPPGTRGRTSSTCFRYSVGEPPAEHGGKTTSACFSYRSEVSSGDAVPPGPSGKTSTTCFRY
jgi:hypothetical protein